MRVTVGIPFHGESPAHFRQAIHSVFAQSHADWELILLGDGPDEDLSDIARSIQDPRVRVFIRETSAGLAARLNEIADLANGELLFRMDADDVMSPVRLEAQVAFLSKRPEVDLLASAAYVINSRSHVLGLCRYQPVPTTAAGFLGATPFVHPSVVAKTSWFRTHRYDESLERSQDKDLWLSAAGDTVFAHIMEPLLYYRVPEVMTYSKYSKTSKHERKVIAKHGRRLAGPLRTAQLLVKSHFRQAVFGGLRLLGQSDSLRGRRSVDIPEAEIDLSEAGLSQALSSHVPGWDAMPINSR